MHVNFTAQAVLLEEQPRGRKSIRVVVDADAGEVLTAMIQLGNERIASALAALFIAGVNVGRAMASSERASA
jgi:hypothetical protein